MNASADTPQGANTQPGQVLRVDADLLEPVPAQ